MLICWFFLSPYRALVLQAHHEGAHISCGLVVDDDHGFFFRDGQHIIAPLRYCTIKHRRNMVTRGRANCLVAVSEVNWLFLSVRHQNSTSVAETFPGLPCGRRSQSQLLQLCLSLWQLTVSKSAVFVSLLLCTGFILIHVKKSRPKDAWMCFYKRPKQWGPKQTWKPQFQHRGMQIRRESLCQHFTRKNA